MRNQKIIYNNINLLKKFNLDYIKIPSGEITNLPFLRYVAKFNNNIILSTGMSTISEIDLAVKTLLNSGLSKKKLAILHCNSAYPTPYKDTNLNVIKILASRYKVSVGFSDHTLGIEAPIAAVALGAKVIEKHFTISKKLKGPDHTSSLEPQELNMMVKSIRNIENALGKDKKIQIIKIKLFLIQLEKSQLLQQQPKMTHLEKKIN